MHNRPGLTSTDPFVALCTLEAQGATKACIDSHMESTTVASPCQTLHELLAWRPRYSWPRQSIYRYRVCVMHWRFSLHINPRRACAARVTVLGLCPPVCLSVSSYSRTAGWPTNGFRTTRAWKLNWNDCVREICRENKRKTNMHNRTSLPRPIIRLLFVPCGGAKKSLLRPSRIGMLSYSVAS